MGSAELGIRFTENKYATRLEVSRDLKMSLIDNIWSNILAYRNNFSSYLTIKSIDNNQFTICNCPTIANKINAVETHLFKDVRTYLMKDPSSRELKSLKESLIINVLNKIATFHNVSVTDIDLRRLIQGETNTLDENDYLSNYLKALKLTSKAQNNQIDIDFLAEIYSKLTGNDELTSFYRMNDDNFVSTRSFIDRIYTACPAKYIDNLMELLFAFLKTSKLTGVVKALVTYYYINYLKPFDAYNEEISTLLAKSVLANTGAGEYAMCIPLENLLNDTGEEVKRLANEVQKTGDITYFINFALDKFETYLTDCSNVNVLKITEELANELYQVEDVTPKEENNKEQNERQIKTNFTNQEPVASQEGNEIAFRINLATIDDKQISLVVEHLLEIDPSLKPKEARFYAKHCIMGRKYTIQQYKRYIGCVYETARTSMDHLVELGYYKKEAIKNKFVYSPISKK